MKLELAQQTFEKTLKYQISRKSVQWELRCSMWANRHSEAKSHFTILQTHFKKCWKCLPSAHRPAPHVMNTLFKFWWSNWKHCVLNVLCQVRLQCKNYYPTYCILLTCHTNKKWQGCESGKWGDHNLLLKISLPKNGLNNVQNCWQCVMSYSLVSHNLKGEQSKVSICV